MLPNSQNRIPNEQPSSVTYDDIHKNKLNMNLNGKHWIISVMGLFVGCLNFFLRTGNHQNFNLPKNILKASEEHAHVILVYTSRGKRIIIIHQSHPDFCLDSRASRSRGEIFFDFPVRSTLAVILRNLPSLSQNSNYKHYDNRRHKVFGRKDRRALH